MTKILPGQVVKRKRKRQRVEATLQEMLVWHIRRTHGIDPMVTPGSFPWDKVGIKRVRVLIARWWRKLGMIAGEPDLFVPHAAGGYHGLFIECKTKAGAKGEGQKKRARDLEARGYRFIWPRGYEQMVAQVDAYFDLNESS